MLEAAIYHPKPVKASGVPRIWHIQVPGDSAAAPEDNRNAESSWLGSNRAGFLTSVNSDPLPDIVRSFGFPH
jgi:hypothetical protein